MRPPLRRRERRVRVGARAAEPTAAPSRPIRSIPSEHLSAAPSWSEVFRAFRAAQADCPVIQIEEPLTEDRGIKRAAIVNGRPLVYRLELRFSAWLAIRPAVAWIRRSKT